MLDPRDWKYEHRLRLLIAAAFGALLGFTHGYSHGSFNLLVALLARPLSAARSIVIGLF